MKTKSITKVTNLLHDLLVSLNLNIYFNMTKNWNQWF